MRIRLFVILLTALVCVTTGAVTPAQAQGTSAQKPPAQTTKPKPTPKLPIGFRAFAAGEAMSMAASSSFESQGGSSIVPGFGVGAEVLNLWRKVFLRVGMSTGSVEGTRGFVIDGEFISNGVPLKLGVRNVELAAGWRNYLKKHPRAAWYFGAGLNIGTNRQESPDPDSGDNDSKSGKGFVGLFGFEFALKKETAKVVKRQIVFGGEVAYRTVGGVLGESGGSEGFKEDDLGGFAVRGLIGIRFRK